MRGFLSLHPDQKKAVILLQLGTFLEYFDLMLYVHMAVLLNELFFPKTDPATTSLLAAFAFCSTYILRPLAALIFGYMGDHIGRKTTVVLTMMMMSTSCLIMATLPPYAQIGITASWMVIICRVLQGFSSMGEIIGASIYLTEITEPPMQYVVVSFIGFFSALGPVVALMVAALSTTYGLNWRYAFWIGVGIALIGTAARTQLRETPDFVDAKRRMRRDIEEAEENNLLKTVKFLKRGSFVQRAEVNYRTALAYFLLQSGWPVFFYFTYIYCSSILKTQFHYSPEQIISQNFVVSLFQLLSFLIITLACRWVFPLKILKIRSYILYALVILFPFLLNNVKLPEQLFFIQAASISFALTVTPAYPLFIRHFPVYKRFTYDSFIYALSRAFIYVIMFFILGFITKYLGNMGLWFIMIPTCIGFAWGLRHFERLEAAKSDEDLPKRPIPLKDYEKLTAANS